MTTEGVDGERIALAGHNVNLNEIFHILKKEFPKLPIQDKELIVDEIKQNGNPIVQRSLMLVGKKFRVDNSKSKKLLHMEYTPIERTVVEMGHQLIKLGVVPQS